ncbi:unnamed protein product [Prorocentrum cordatum]|uniref:Uncharacterized protein n=1 Tax=Prorocentrum cordatum TaxID=2364126 RepID=A0ABN9X5I9_9DINO|nr:unnamed protein product [Polarella glacialis]
MRRGPGIAGLKQSQAQRSTIAAAGDQSKAAQLADAKANFEVLRAKLTEFAQKHRSRINSDPQFRQAFCEMCAAAGVDPLASSKVLTVCIQTREMNGGLLDLRECLSLVQALRPADQTISEEDDVETAISSLSALGRGVGVRRCGDRRTDCVLRAGRTEHGPLAGAGDRGAGGGQGVFGGPDTTARLEA